jgi:hypothetical protein
VADIPFSAFLDLRFTSITAPDCTMCGSLLIRLGTIVRFLDSPSEIVIPSTAREIGQGAFERVTSLKVVSFEEGLLSIGTRAFHLCPQLQIGTLPASLKVIGENAFSGCRSLDRLAFAAESQLECIQKEAFEFTPLKAVVLPATVKEIDPSAFTPNVWRSMKFEGPPPHLITPDFLCSADSRILLRNFSKDPPVVIPAGIEVIGPRVFRGYRWISQIGFESGTRLREIQEMAFSEFDSLKQFIVPSSVEIIGDRCFEGCGSMTTITFDDASKLKRMGERAFAKSGLSSITIPASVEEIAGSAFVGCPLAEILVAAGSRNFVTEGNLLLTSNGTEIVRYFGRDFEVIVPAKIQTLGKSCFQACSHLGRVRFETGSKLRSIGRSALSHCYTLRSILIPASVEIIGEGAFRRSGRLESCLIAENANLLRIERKAFSNCYSLRSFYVPQSVQMIGENCFNGCEALESCLIAENANLRRIEKGAFFECQSISSFSIPKGIEVICDDCFKKCRSLCRLSFVSAETLKRLIGDFMLDEALENFGLDELSGLLRIEIEDGEADFDFPGWSSAADKSSHLTLISDIP